MATKKTYTEKKTYNRPIYLDCNATTPIDPVVSEVLLRYLTEEFGNEGSRTHEFGAAAKQAVQNARDQVAALVGARREEVVFTSGATESNNLAILGLAPHGRECERKHIVSTRIEHKAVMEPIEHLERHGFEVSWVGCDRSGAVSADEVLAAIRHDTLLVSVMHVNNETGIRQPIEKICEGMTNLEAYLHVDAAQSFGKELASLKNPRIDLLSGSGHKIYAPKGVGVLVTRRRDYDRPPLHPLSYGGGQERGLRPGTLPVALIVGLGLACELATKHAAERAARNESFRAKLLEQFAELNPVIHGDPALMVPHTLNFRIPGIDSEALMVALKELVAVSNGSACTSSSYSPSHVLVAMGLSEEETAGAVRMSWCHLTPDVDWEQVVHVIRGLM